MAFKFTGISELKAVLQEKTNLDSARRVVRQNGAELQARAQRNAPVDTGTLKRSIGLEIEDGGLTARSAATADYAAYQEWGTRFMEAHPFMTPAFEEQKEQFKNDMDKLVR